MAKKKPTHQEKSTDQQQHQHQNQNQKENNHNPQNHKMEANNNTTTATAIEDPNEKLSKLQSLNGVLIKETAEKRQEVSALLESKKSLESELTRSVSQVEALRAELAKMEDGGLDVEVQKGVVSAFVESQAVSELDSVRREKEELERENEGLRREKEEVERKLEEVEREMGDVVKERDEMEKAKFDGDLEIGSMKKLENELRSEIKKEKEALKQAIRENEGLKLDYEVQTEAGDKLRKKLGEIEAKEKSTAEKLRNLELKFDAKAKALEERDNEVESMRVEVDSMEKECEELKREIEGLKGEKEVIMREKAELEKERSEQGVRIGELEKEAIQLNAILLSLKEDEEKWRVKFFELEKTNAEVEAKVEGLGSEMNALMEEKKEKEKEIERLMGEKSSAEVRLGELEKELESVKRVKEDVVEEKNWLEQMKSKQESEIFELQSEVNELRSNLSLLQESYSDHVEKNEQLVSQIDDHKSSLERVSVERDDAKKTLEEEKMNGMKLKVRVSEITKKMEETAKVIEELRATGDTIVGEKKELENKHSKLVEEKGLAEKKLADAQKKFNVMEAAMKSKTDMFESALTMLKNTVVQLSMENGKKGENEGVTKKERAINGGDIEPYLAELEAIRAAFRSREEKVGEMQQEMESLQMSVMEARKKKSFWTLVSSATTILAAAVSLLYASRAR